MRITSLRMFLMKIFLNQNHQTRKLIYLVKEGKEEAKKPEKEGHLDGRRVQLTAW